jgi:hypothetical protein
MMISAPAPALEPSPCVEHAAGAGLVEGLGDRVQAAVEGVSGQEAEAEEDGGVELLRRRELGALHSLLLPLASRGSLLAPALRVGEKGGILGTLRNLLVPSALRGLDSDKARCVQPGRARFGPKKAASRGSFRVEFVSDPKIEGAFSLIPGTKLRVLGEE